MLIERQNQDIVFRLKGPIDIRAAQKLVDYFNLIASIAKNQGTNEQAAELARETDKAWWLKNRDRFIK